MFAVLGEKMRRRARALKTELAAVYLCWRDPETPWYAKALILLVLAYAVSPIDLIPDFIPVVGYLDDLLLLPLGILLAVRLIPGPVYARHKAAAASFDDPRLRRIGLALTLTAWALAAAVVLKIAAG